MKFYDPQVSLYKHTYIDGDNQYFLRIIMFTDNSILESNGINVDSGNASETIGVELIVNENKRLPSLECVHPITYTANLGNLPDEEEYTLLINFTFNTSDVYANRKPRPKSVKARPIEMGRPIGEDTVEAAWAEQFNTTLGN